MIAPDKPFFMYFCPGRDPRAAPRPARSGSRSTRGKFDMGYEAYRELVFERQKQIGIFPADTELTPLNPYAEETERRRQALAPAGRRAPVGLAVRRRAAAVLRAWRRSTPASSRTPTTRSGACSTSWRSPGSCENTIVVLVSDNGASGRGRPERLGQREQVLQRHPRHDRGEPEVPRRPRLARRRTTTTRRLGVGVQHAVQDVEALQLRGRRRRPDGDLVAEGHRGEGRAAPPVPARHRHRRRRSTTCLGVELPEEVKGYHQIPLEGVSFRYDLRGRGRADAEGDRLLLDARLARDLAQGLEGRQPCIRRSPAGATSTRTAGSCSTPTRTPPRAMTSPPSIRRRSRR